MTARRPVPPRPLHLGRFLYRYTKPYVGWAVVAGLAVLVFAASSAMLVALIKPIFGEVLLADHRAVEGTPLSSLGLATGTGDEPPAGVEVGADLSAGSPEIGTEDAGDTEDPEDSSPAGPESPLEELQRHWDIEDQLQSGYDSLKRRFGVDEEGVVYFVPLLFIFIFLLRSTANFWSGYSFQHIGLGTTTDIRNDLYEHILRQSSRFHTEHPSGELMARVISDVAMMQNAVSNRLLDLVQQSITLLFLLGLLLSIDFKLALVCLVAMPVLVYPIVRFGKGMRRISHRSQERMADLSTLMAEGVRGHRVVQAFGMEPFESRRFRQATGRHLKVNLRAQTLSNLSSPVVESLAVVGSAALLVYAGQKIRSDNLSAPELIMFLANLFMLYDPVRKLNKVNLVLQEALAAAQRVGRVLGTPNEVAEKDDAVDIVGLEEAIVYDDVSFSYEVGRQPVLRGVDLTIERGEIIALVGPSGAGKSTLVNLLPRFFDVTGGSLTLDGVDVRDVTLASLREQIGIVTQETLLFNDSIRNNIAYGRSDLSLERVREAAAAAYADAFVMEMPEGYDTVIGESGARLSGGQRQRLAIARAILKNPPILILDEATSQLDSESEALVQKALANLMTGRTTLVIAHRLSTVTRADRIVVMEDGRIVDVGSHAELLDRGGTYKRLYDLQFEV
jgi:ATP-binding cassette, subfamily B, bacterial MsbA